jgi:transposase
MWRKKTYIIGGGKRRRCARCEYEFHELSGKWINGVKISRRLWLWKVRLFILELSARKISRQTGASYPMALKAANVINVSLLGSVEVGKKMILGGEVEIGDCNFGGRRKGERGKVVVAENPVFGKYQGYRSKSSR